MERLQLITLFFGLAFYVMSLVSVVDADIMYSFTTVDYDWHSDVARSLAVSSGEYVVENNLITGVKIHGDDVYVTVPRWKPGVPATLNKLVTNPGTNGNVTVLQPYPSWAMNRRGHCGAFQYVQSMEIDPNTGYMWIIDVGRFGSLQPHHQCPPKLTILDMDTETTVRSFAFPPNVASGTSNFMNDIVLDYVDGKAKFAYITDTRDAKIYVYDYDRNSAYFFQHDSMKAQPLIKGVQDNLRAAPVDGIAMSYDFKYVYYSTLSSLQLYGMPTSTMRNHSADFASALINVGQKRGGSDGMTCGQTSLFYAALELDAVYKTNVGPNGIVSLQSQQEVVSDAKTVNWVDTFAWNGTDLWFTANKLPLFLSGHMNFTGSDTNIAIWKVNVGEKGYLDNAHARTVSSTHVVG